MSIEKLRTEHNVETRWLHFPLHPKTPPEGIPMQELYRNRDPESTKAAGNHLKSAMADAGLPYNRRTRLDNSRMAQELGAWADTQPSGADFHDAVFEAYFVNDRTISDKDTLVDIAESVGLDSREARNVLDARSFSKLVSQDWDRAWSSEVSRYVFFHLQRNQHSQAALRIPR